MREPEDIVAVARPVRADGHVAGTLRRACLRARSAAAVRAAMSRWRYPAAWLWRRLLVRTTFVAITGSVGKTTAKDCLAAILRDRSAMATLRNQNDMRFGVPTSVLRVRPWHRFAVIEIGTSRPGVMRRSARLVRPDIAVVLAVARTHTNEFQDLDATASEKAELVRALRPSGLAILNADDPRVAGMAAGCSGRVVTFGQSAGADVRADEIASAWPGRLAFRVHAGGAPHRVRTALVGEHWASSVLAALAAGQACGVPMADAVAAVARVPPHPARMQPVRLPSGATLVRDEYNSAVPVMDAALAAMASATAGRRILVLGDVSDSRERPRTRLSRLGRRAAALADVAVFVGEHARYGVRAAVAAGLPAAHAHGFTGLREAAAFLRAELRAGDLVLLKGRATDHFSRIAFAQFGEVACWRLPCPYTILCDNCPRLGASVRFVAER